MKRRSLAVLIMVLLLANASALTSSYESTSVSRIVGNSTEDMLHQLEIENLDLQHASLATTESYNFYDLTNVFKSVFLTYSEPIFLTGATAWYANNNIMDVFDNYQSELFVMHVLQSATNYVSEEDVKTWEGLDENDLVIIDIDYAGAFLPNQESFASEIAPKATLVASNSFSSMNFVKAFVCNLGKYETLGDTFRQARNNYYHYTKNAGWLGTGEFLGLTLISYSLYGGPYLEIDVPNFNEDELSKYCKDYLENDFSPGKYRVSRISSFSKSSSVQTPYEYADEFNIDGYTIESIDNFSILSANKTEIIFENEELVLPSRIFLVKFPLGTLITNFSVIKINDSVDLTIPDIPEWKSGFVNRTCYLNQSSASVEFSHTFTEDSELVIVRINPVEIVDCISGQLRLYRHFEYNVNYMPYSPVIISDIDAPENSDANDDVEIGVRLQAIKSGVISGNLLIKDRAITLAEEQISFSGDNLTEYISITVPNYEGTKIFDVEFLQNEDMKTKSSFSMMITGGSIEQPDCVPYAEICDDGIDNDCDYSTDCVDSDCENDAECQTPSGCIPSTEVCDLEDNDCDGNYDEDLGSHSCGIGECYVTVQNCVNGLLQSCVPKNPTPEICNDGKDNDCDGKSDCADSECSSDASCIVPITCTPSPEICNDGKDNDCDGYPDSYDSECTCDKYSGKLCKEGMECRHGTKVNAYDSAGKECCVGGFCLPKTV